MKKELNALCKLYKMDKQQVLEAAQDLVAALQDPLLYDLSAVVGTIDGAGGTYTDGYLTGVPVKTRVTIIMLMGGISAQARTLGLRADGICNYIVNDGLSCGDGVQDAKNILSLRTKWAASLTRDLDSLLQLQFIPAEITVTAASARAHMNVITAAVVQLEALLDQWHTVN